MTPGERTALRFVLLALVAFAAVLLLSIEAVLV